MTGDELTEAALELRAILSNRPPYEEGSPTAKWADLVQDKARIVLNGLLSQRTPSAVTIDDRAVEVFGPGILERTGPPSIAEMTPGTTFSEGVRWTVARDLHGNTFLHRYANGYGQMRLPEQVDPSTIRDVVVPK